MSDESTMPLFRMNALRENYPEYARTFTATGNSVAAKARRTDPVTSHQAAQKVTNQTEVQSMILSVLKIHGPMCDAAILARYLGRGVSESGLRTRRSELVAKGLVQDSGKRVKLPSGRSSIVWEATT